MKRLMILLVSLLFTTTTIWASLGDYTYQKDKRFTHVKQLNGQTFVPQEYIEGKGGRVFVRPDKIKIHISSAKMAFEGVDKLGFFNIVAKTKTKTGFNFKLTDGRGRDFSKLIIVMNGEYVRSMHLTSKKLGEYTFFLPQKSKSQLKQERRYFSSTRTTKSETYDELCKEPIVPYQQIRNVNNPYSFLEKISVKQKFSIDFAEGSVLFKDRKDSKRYRVKRVKKRDLTIKDNPAVKQVLDVKIKDKAKRIKVFLNDKNQIEFIELKGTRYLLMS